MTRVLQPLEERLKLVDPPLQGFDAPLVPRIRRLRSRVRGPPAATQLNDTGEDRNSTHRPRVDCRNSPWSKPPAASFSEAARGEEEARPNERYQAAAASTPKITRQARDRAR